jgi:hypothetical protein
MLRKLLNPPEWPAAMARTRPGHVARAGGGGLYVIVTLLALMELMSPGAVGRIAEQPAGAVLLIVLATGFAAVAACEVAAAALGANDAPTEDSGHALNAFLHGALAVGSADIALGGGDAPARATGVALCVLALLLVGGGAYELLSLRNIEASTDTHHGRRRLALWRRDLLVRGLAFAVLGGALLTFALPVALGSAAPVGRAISDTVWLAASVLALGAYGVNALTLLAEPESSWQTE